MTMQRPRLFVTEWDGTLVAEVAAYSRYTLVLRYNNWGRWWLSVPRDTGLAMMERGRKLLLHYGETIITGPILGVDIRPGQVVAQVVGGTDLVLLAMRLALPEPGGDFSAQAYDQRTGPVESVVKGYVKDNASQDAVQAARAFPFVVASDQGRGETVTGRARFHELLAFCRALIAAAGNQHRMSLSNGVFEVEPVVDHGNAPMFADWRGASWGVAWDAPRETYIYAGGSGKGTARLIAEVENTDAEDDFWRIEGFYDRRSEDDADVLVQAAQERLADGAPRYGFVVTATVPVGKARYGAEYREGDYATAQVRGVAAKAQIREVRIEYRDGAGWSETVGVGVEVTPLVWERLRAELVARRLENLEVAQ